MVLRGAWGTSGWPAAAGRSVRQPAHTGQGSRRQPMSQNIHS
jgi:hypothetical protein